MLGLGFVVWASVRFVVVVFSELVQVVEPWIVEFECLPEAFDLALRGGFSNGAEDMFDAVLLAELGESCFCCRRCRIVCHDR